MKTITIKILAVFIMATGCKSKPDPKPPIPDTQVLETTSSHNDPEQTTSGTQILVTEFAQWTVNKENPVSGQYDAENGSFIPCSKDNVLSVPKNQIKIITGGSCDETPGTMNKEILVVQTGTNKVISREISVDTVNKVGTYKVNGTTQKFPLNALSMKRLRKEPDVTRTILKRKL